MDALQVGGKELDRHPFDDAQLRLLVGIRAEVRRARQGEQILRRRGDVEEGVRVRRRVDRVGQSLGGEQRRARWAKVVAAHSRYLHAGEDRCGPDARVPEPRVVSGRQSSVATV